MDGREVISRRRLLTAGGFFIAAPWCSEISSAAIAPAPMRTLIAVKDVIEARYPLDLMQGTNVYLSPDGGQYLFPTKRGSLSSDTITIELYCGALNSLETAGRPKLVCILTTSGKASDPGDGRASPTHPAANRIQWLDDNSRIVMLWTDGEGPNQVVTIDTQSGEMVRLTSNPGAVRFYALDGQARIVAYSAYSQTQTKPIDAPFGAVESMNAADAVIGLSQVAGFLSFVETVQGGGPRAVDLGGFRYLDGSCCFSPSADYAVWLRLARVKPPEYWHAYGIEKLDENIKNQNGDPGGGWVPQLALLDVRSARVKPLIDAPNLPGQPPQAVWAPDGRSVVVGPVLPPAANGVEGLPVKAVVLEVRLSDGACLAIPVPANDFWRPVLFADDGVLTLSNGKRDIRFRRDGEWHAVDGSGPAPRRDVPAVHVELRQGLNAPPLLYARDGARGREVLALDVDPGLKAFTLGRVEALDCSFKRVPLTGRLYYPVAFKAGQRYPLVIQTHGYAPLDQFSLTGMASYFGTTYAAQALAAHDIMVVQLGDYTGEIAADEAPTEMRAFEALIDYLVEQGLVDRGAVGLSGFSRTGWQVEYALTHSDFPYAAAIAADNIDGSYMQAVMEPQVAFSYGVANGGPPYGKTLERWLSNAPGFLADRIRTPLRLEVDSGGGPRALLQAWEIFSRARDSQLPVELVLLPDAIYAGHPIQRPRQQFASQQGAVDWFRFWLKGEKDPDPLRADQYRRWTRLQQLRDAATAGDQRDTDNRAPKFFK